MEYVEQDRKLGLILTFVGIFFTISGLGMMLDKGFLALGNLAITLGLCYFLGFGQFAAFVWKQGDKNRVAGVSYVFGLLLIVFGKPGFGLVFETAGFVCFFRPFAYMFGLVFRNVPGVGALMRLFQPKAKSDQK